MPRDLPPIVGSFQIVEGSAKPARTRQRKPTLVSVSKQARGSVKEAVSVLGLKPRKLQLMSQRGEIPGAAKLGRQWTYDLAKLNRFVEQQEQATICQSAKPRPDATGAGKFSGAKFKFAGVGSGGRLRQMIRQSQERAAKQAKRER
jgi:hypothetical protein